MTEPITESHEPQAAKYADGAKPVLLPEWVARRRGPAALVTVLPEPAELFLDIDDEADLQVMDDVLGILAGAGFAIVKAKAIQSKGDGIHVYLKAPRELTEVERIALQACLGSDRTREALSFVRYVHGKHAPTVFFEMRDEKPVRPRKDAPAETPLGRTTRPRMEVAFVRSIEPPPISISLDLSIASLA